jgi:hypothetical protein
MYLLKKVPQILICIENTNENLQSEIIVRWLNLWLKLVVEATSGRNKVKGKAAPVLNKEPYLERILDNHI